MRIECETQNRAAIAKRYWNGMGARTRSFSTVETDPSGELHVVYVVEVLS